MSPEPETTVAEGIDTFLIKKDASRIDSFISNFRAIADESLQNGVEISYFINLHRAAITTLLLQRRSDLVPRMRSFLSPEARESLPSFCDWLNNRGFLVRQERNIIDTFQGSNHEEWQTTEQVSELLFHDICDNESNGKVTTLEQAMAEMGKFREQGYRNVIAMGTYDVGTLTQEYLIRNNFRMAVKRFGKFIVFVPGDNETALAKGAGRPYDTLEKRMEFVRKIPGVNYVAPIFFPSAHTLEQLECCYSELHRDLAPLTHFRVIGEGPTDKIYESVLEQCTAVGIPMIYTNFPRLQSTTQVGRMIHGY